MEKYCAFIADIVGSKVMEESVRIQVQQDLLNKIGSYNEEFVDKMAVNLDFSGGDQVQALFYRPEEAYFFACCFRDAMHPIPFHIGLGIGDWLVQIPDQSTNAQDGSAYHNARKASELADPKNQGLIFCSESYLDAFINAMISQEYNLFNSQKVEYKELAILFRERFPLEPRIHEKNGLFRIIYNQGSIQKIADEIGTAKQGVAKKIQRGKINKQREIQSAIYLALRDLFEHYILQRG